MNSVMPLLNASLPSILRSLLDCLFIEILEMVTHFLHAITSIYQSLLKEIIRKPSEINSKI